VSQGRRTSVARAPRKGRRNALLFTGIVLIVLIAWASWVSVRGLMARDALQTAASQIRAAQSDGPTELLGSLDRISTEVGARTADAADLTSDPLWRAAEVLPWAGPNLSAFRETTAAVDNIVRSALPPLASVADTIDADALTLRDGGLPVEELRAAQPSIAEAQKIVAGAADDVLAINSEDVLPQIGQAVAQVRDLAVEADEMLTGLNLAAQLLPSMLGVNGQRDFLLLFQNNAELRASGGIPGATSVVSAQAGSIGLVDQSNSTDFRGSTPESILPLTEEEQSLFTPILGRFIQNATLTPDFARSGELAQARWNELTGQQVDGIAAIDPIALSYLLEATGPVQLADGSELTSENAVDSLLSGVYQRFADEPEVQDAYYAEAAAAVFEQVRSFGGDAGAMLNALAQGVQERRILVWSADVDEQALLEQTPLAGRLPQSTEDYSAFGVFFNDATGAKMDYYLDATIGASSATCRNDLRPETTIGFSLTSSAPADAILTLSEYETGGGVFGVEPGRIRTEALIYAPPGSVITEARVDGVAVPLGVQEHDGHPVARFVVELGPGETQAVQIDVLGDLHQSEQLSIEHTPMVRETQLLLDPGRSCASDLG